jgi:hypothetical protein
MIAEYSDFNRRGGGILSTDTATAVSSALAIALASVARAQFIATLFRLR